MHKCPVHKTGVDICSLDDPASLAHEGTGFLPHVQFHPIYTAQTRLICNMGQVQIFKG